MNYAVLGVSADNVKELDRLARINRLVYECVTPNYFSIYSRSEDYSMGFHDFTDTNLFSGTIDYVIEQLKKMCGEVTYKPNTSLCTIAEATWITDILKLPSERFEDVRRAVNIVLEARDK